MRVLLVHNFYQQPGGEDQVFWAEGELLESRGHTVHRFIMHNDEVEGMGKLELASKMLWNRETAATIRKLVREHHIDLVHVHNTLPIISPAVLHAAASAGSAVVQTLHNYRLVCPAATLFRDGHICEECLGKRFAWPGVKHRCYRGSRSATLGVALTTAFHHARRTYHRDVGAFIALTDFMRDKLIEGGWPASKIVVKPNSLLADPGFGKASSGGALFVGRLSEEKGIITALNAWKLLKANVPLLIVGDGPLRDLIREQARNDRRIRWLGYRAHDEVLQFMRQARFLVFPSAWYEGFPITLLEAFAVGLPVIASKLGAMVSLIQNGVTGLHTAPGSAEDLAEKVSWLIEQSGKAQEMARNARAEYERKYSADANYQQLISIYQRLLS